MRYRLESDVRLETAVRKLARAELDAALEHARSDTPDSASVHELRMHCKKLRALLRLVRGGIGDAYAAENAALRDAARLLAGLRDAGVALYTHDRLLASFGTAIEVPAAPAVRDQLDARLLGPDALQPFESIEAVLAEVAGRLGEARERASAWRVRGPRLQLVQRGLQRIYERARRARAAASGSSDPRRFHEWRKQVKYHWYHLRLLSPRGGRTPARTKRMDRLGKLLGEAHDLAIYDQQLRKLGTVDAEPGLRALAALAASWRAELESSALDQSKTLFTDKPKAVLAPIVQRWR